LLLRPRQTFARSTCAPYIYRRAGGLLDTLARFPAALRRFAEAHGVGRIYHETVTWTFLALINEGLERMSRDCSFAAFIAATLISSGGTASPASTPGDARLAIRPLRLRAPDRWAAATPAV
jgi:hypothetical protein